MQALNFTERQVHRYQTLPVCKITCRCSNQQACRRWTSKRFPYKYKHKHNWVRWCKRKFKIVYNNSNSRTRRAGIRTFRRLRILPVCLCRPSLIKIWRKLRQRFHLHHTLAAVSHNTLAAHHYPKFHNMVNSQHRSTCKANNSKTSCNTNSSFKCKPISNNRPTQIHTPNPLAKQWPDIRQHIPSNQHISSSRDVSNLLKAW